MKDKILETVRECEGLRSTEIATLLDHDLSSVNSGLRRLLSEGKVRRELDPAWKGKGRAFIYSLGNGTPALVSKRQTTEPGWHARYDEMVLRIQELEQWQVDALARYPDLAVPDIVLRARKIAARTNPDFADSLRSGKKDSSPLMLAVIAALEEVAA